MPKHNHNHSHDNNSATLSFTPYAWAKYLYFRDAGPTEISAIGQTQHNRPDLIVDLHLLKQEASPAFVSLDGEALADYLDTQTTNGLTVDECCRVFLHTHPGNSATPSGTDITTYNEFFANAPWSAFVILARGGQTWAQIRYGGRGPRTSVTANLTVDWSAPFPQTDHKNWRKAYTDNVEIEKPKPVSKIVYTGGKWSDHEKASDWPNNVAKGIEDSKKKAPTKPTKRSKKAKAKATLPDSLTVYCLDCLEAFERSEYMYDRDWSCCYCGSANTTPDADEYADELDIATQPDTLDTPDTEYELATDAEPLFEGKSFHELTDADWQRWEALERAQAERDLP